MSNVQCRMQRSEVGRQEQRPTSNVERPTSQRRMKRNVLLRAKPLRRWNEVRGRRPAKRLDLKLSLLRVVERFAGGGADEHQIQTSEFRLPG